MKIYNEDKTIVLNQDECDLQNGRFVEDFIVVGKRESRTEQIINPDKSITIIQHPDCNIKESILIYKPYSEKEKFIMELDELEHWFLHEYRELFEKCNRKISIQKTMRDGSDPKEILSNLYIEAEQKSDRIIELRNLIIQL